jgi:hypothetical protein
MLDCPHCASDLIGRSERVRPQGSLTVYTHVNNNNKERKKIIGVGGPETPRYSVLLEKISHEQPALSAFLICALSCHIIALSNVYPSHYHGSLRDQGVKSAFILFACCLTRTLYSTADLQMSGRARAGFTSFE